MDGNLIEEGVSFRGYRILRKLGSGGTGEVYLAHHVVLGADFAVKLVAGAVLRDDAELRARFYREAKIAARIRHPALVSVYDAGFDEPTGLYFIVMDYLPGGTVADQLARDRRFSVERALRIARTVAEGLAELDRHGIVHRDVKPANMLVAADGSVKLSDPGIARLTAAGARTVTETGFALGTPAYMPFEQIVDSHAVDGRADVYALGVSLFEMLAGFLPDGELSSSKLLKKRVDGARIPDIRESNQAIPDDIAELIFRMTEPDVRKRLKSAAEVVSAIALRQGEDSLPTAALGSGKPRPFRRSVVVWAFAGLGLLVLALGTGCLYLWSEIRKVPQVVTVSPEPVKPLVPAASVVSSPREKVVVREEVRHLMVTNVVTVTNRVVVRTESPMVRTNMPSAVGRLPTVLTNAVEGVLVLAPAGARAEQTEFMEMVETVAARLRAYYGIPENRFVQNDVNCVELQPGNGKFRYDAKSRRLCVGVAYGGFPEKRADMAQVVLKIMAKQPRDVAGEYENLIREYVRQKLLSRIDPQFGDREIRRFVGASPWCRMLWIADGHNFGDAYIPQLIAALRRERRLKHIAGAMSKHDFAAVMSVAMGQNMFPFMRGKGLPVDDFATNVRVRNLPKAEFFGE